jgi:DNA-binding CsgD family transcriptional regulator
VAGGLVGREFELQAVQSLLQAGKNAPVALLIDGDPGIGKTTVCRAASDAATESGFTTLTTAGASTEVSLAWAGLADLVAGIDEVALACLAPLHQQTLQAIRAGHDGPLGGERLVATAFRMALQELSRRRPVLIIIDDAQWLDEPSRRAIGFAVRRVSSPMALLAAYRSGEPGGEDRSWVQPPDPRALTRVTLGPMSPSDLRSLLASRPEFAPSRSVIQRIHAISSGNPFYALELARFLKDNDEARFETLPPTLTGLMRARIGRVDEATTDALVAAAVALEPTVETIAAATGRQPTDVVDLLQPMESRGVLTFEGSRIRFTHPLIASGIIAEVDPSVQRRMHRRLAGLVTHPEQRARHLALSSPHGEPSTLAALDAAAESASTRAAFSTAAELMTLAVQLGGADDQMRLLRAAEYHFRAGALDDAESFVAPIIEDLPAGFLRAAGLMLLGAIRGYRDGIASTIDLFKRAVEEAEGLLPLRTQALVMLSLATGIGGDMATCVSDARRARADADATGLPELRCQALSLWSHVSFMYGLGTDSEALRDALSIGDSPSDAPVMLRPKPVYALNCAWTGRLDEARTAMTEVWRRCEELGTELDLLWATEQLTWIDIASGRYDEAEGKAREAVRLAQQIGGELPMITAQTAIANAAAYRGRVADAKMAADLATERATAVGLNYLADPPLMSLAFAQVSDGRYADALTTLAPLLKKFDPIHDIEIMAAAWIPDAAEALTALRRIDEAEVLAGALETSGVHHDRPWMLAVGARCRALVAAARGDLHAAIEHATQSLEFHDRLPMPFERARTQLLLGQLQRRRRHTKPARDNLRMAAAIFEELDSPLWIARARRELARLTTGSDSSELTDSERQVAERAAAGQSNKEIGASLFLSAKTVEMHLSRAYRKLGIRSRAQLADCLRDSRPASR